MFDSRVKPTIFLSEVSTAIFFSSYGATHITATAGPLVLQRAAQLLVEGSKLVEFSIKKIPYTQGDSFSPVK